MNFAGPDLSALYASLGEVVTLTPVSGSPVTGRGTFDCAGKSVFGEVMASEPSLRYPVSVFPAVARGDVFTIGGTQWRVRQAPRPLFDGAEVEVLLETVA